MFLNVHVFYAEPRELATVEKSKNDRNETLLPWCFKFQEAVSPGNHFFYAGELLIAEFKLHKSTNNVQYIAILLRAAHRS